jgi:hypothetical protein
VRGSVRRRDARPTCELFFRWSEPPGFSARLMLSSEAMLPLSSGSLGSFEPAQPILVLCEPRP